MNILAIGAHPDDVEILCAGTLAKYAATGHKVFIGIATNGDVGSHVLSREETREIRHAEAERSAEVIGAELLWLGLRDEFLFDNEESRILFINMIRQADADVVFVHAEDDYHADHRTAATIARNCRHQIDVPLIKTDAPPRPIPHMIIMDNIGSEGRYPEGYVDISDFMDTKLQMLREHKSQAVYLDATFGVDYAEQVVTQARYRGFQMGGAVKYAEGFRSLNDYPIKGDWSLLPW
jgi:LmbE family N-acetylglucosaminyl deacetylase